MIPVGTIHKLTTKTEKFLCSRETLHLTLLWYSTIGIWFWSLSLTIEVPFFAPYLTERANLGAFVILAKGMSATTVLLVPLFMRKGLLFGCYACGILGAVCGLILIFLWKVVIPPNEVFPHGFSIGFLLTVFVLTGLDSIRFVLFMMYVQKFSRKCYITATLIGSESGAWIASTLALVENQFGKNSDELTKNPVFTPTLTSTVLVTIYCSTLAVFILYSQKLNLSSNREYEVIPETPPEDAHEVVSQILQKLDLELETSGDASYRVSMYIIWFITYALVFNGMPPFQSYSTLPYGQSCFNTAVATWGFSIPASVALAHNVRIRKVSKMFVLLALFLIDCAVLIYIATQSPDPPGKGTDIAPYFITLLWFLQGVLGFYLSSTSSYNLGELNESAMKTGAIVSQFGCLAGSLVSFAVVSFNLLQTP